MPPVAKEEISERQAEVLESLILAGTSKGAARALGCGPRNIEAILQVIKRKLNVRTTLQAAIAYDRMIRPGEKR